MRLNRHPVHRAAFTLMELSLVLLVLSLLAAAAIRYANALNTANNNAATYATMDIIDSALYAYRMQFNRLPCPSDITQAESTGLFGLEDEMQTTGAYNTTSGFPDGLCTGYNFINSGTDPDSSDPLYDSTTASQVVGGGVPTKTLHLADRYAYDAWGRKILYVVDKRITNVNAFTTYPVYSTTIGAVVVVKVYNDSLANAMTYKGLYALVSGGANGHGSYNRVPIPTSSISGCNTTTGASCSSAFNFGSDTNLDEQKNCHCSSSASAQTFDRIFVQNTQNNTNGGASSVTFDDLVRFKTRAQMAAPSELQ